MVRVCATNCLCVCACCASLRTRQVVSNDQWIQVDAVCGTLSAKMYIRRFMKHQLSVGFPSQKSKHKVSITK